MPEKRFKKTGPSSASVADQSRLLQIARQTWGPGTTPKVLEPSLVETIYETVTKSNESHRLVTLLESSQYLEQYLWPLFDLEQEPTANKSVLMSLVLMINEKFRERVPAWKVFEEVNPEKFPHFFASVTSTCLETFEKLPIDKECIPEATVLLSFLIHSFNSLEVELVRHEVQKLVSLGIWVNLEPGRLEQELKSFPKLKKYWNALLKKEKQMDKITLARQNNEKSFLYKLIRIFIDIVKDIPDTGPVESSLCHYCEKFIELITDLMCQPLTRRFLVTLIDDIHFTILCSDSSLYSREPEGHLFSKLLDRLKFYCGFEVNSHTGEALTEHFMLSQHYERITSLQLAAFKLFPDLREFSLSTVAGVDTRDSLVRHFSALSPEVLHRIAAYLHLVPPLPDTDLQTSYSPSFLLEILVSHHERRTSQLEELNSMPLYPTETVLWDESFVPNEYFEGEGCFALPKLNLQFLTLHDYLLRNFILFRLESTYEIKEDIEDVVSRMKPWINPEGETHFAGWARMGQPIVRFSIVEVGQPKVGENRPSRVKGDVKFPISKDSVGAEWEGLKKHDVCFLVSIRANMGINDTFSAEKNFATQIGVQYVRGCEVEGMLDSEGKVIEEGPDPKPVVKGDTRTFRVWLDTNQYQQDMERVVRGEEDVYETFNIFVRRKPKENNFKAVLESIRDLINTECAVPDWIHDIFLGYGDPSAAHYTKIPKQINTLNFNDTFLSLDHLSASFPQYQCTVANPEEQIPPFKITFPEERISVGAKRKLSDDESKPILTVQPFVIENRGPYPYNIPKKNTVLFTPTQVEAIRAGMQPGLSLVVGPPGTGKTDVAVQIISNIYHNFPEQRTLLVTHSNQALNQLFEKIMELDIDERHLLRLGHGEEELQTEKDFSRYGRVNFILALRLELLQEVERLQKSLNVTGDVSYTCETAAYFFLYQVSGRWEKYASKIKSIADKPEGLEAISKHFPFLEYFSNAPQPLFKGNSFDEDWDIAQGCYRHIKKIFEQLDEFRAFELLRSSRDRINYLLIKEAKIIALTCTHAALKRKDLVDLSFKYDNVLMEEAAQILEVETFIPLMLQTPVDGHNRLKRVIMIGDHHQLPPVIKNQAFQKFSNMEQSMFARFVRLGVPVTQLDAQGRARPSLCALYNWRYLSLGNLPHVMESREYMLANGGFEFDYQLINVEDFNGVGETTPTPYFYQNLGEAEYAVALYMYMRLQGYPPDKIAILTTYNGQKHLIRDVLQKRCARNPVFGLPEKVTTVDRYQGQQNDYIIISLVRSRHIGHLRDVRRLVVAMSRARLGLYILGRVSLFRYCKELQPAFDLLMKRPCSLHIVPDEMYGTDRPVSCPPQSPVVIVPDMSFLANCVYRDYHSRVHALQAKQSLVPPPPPQSTAPPQREEAMEGEQQEEGEQEEEKGEEERGEGDSTQGRQDDDKASSEEEWQDKEDPPGEQEGGMEVVQNTLPPSPPPSPPTTSGSMEQ
ncbi:PREDICTED: intron-binding protein aquarius isoform X2 [Amphimedon queenslandica]|uniref:Intron-binding protein aquarius n=1 Tax=Amphimedon queenslandica TaxID=400682 RepID=A0AAN0JPW1_AMPQE|nr:PREDICTED: intron-binding protein aquarius isoform X2 [Amphimedon queenslandica]|eukprot:XP_019858857.1 PREDICTED: intron-binding protein aquarius isoform X2 [Amphimedon queenslandica]